VLDIRVNFSVPAILASGEITALRGSEFRRRLGKLFLHDSGFGSKFNDESIAPMVLLIHQLRHLLSQFGLVIRIDNPAKSHVSIAVHFERDSGVVLDILNPVSLLTIL